MVRRSVVALVSVLVLAAVASARAGDSRSCPTSGHPQVGDSLNCRLVGSWPFGPSYTVALDQGRDLAFMGSGGGVYVVDVSDSARPTKLSEAIRTRGLVRGLCYSADRLYIAAGQAGLEIWDVTDPAAPAKLGACSTPGYARGVAVSGAYAYVADHAAGLRVISVAIPQSPQEVGYCDTPGDARGVAVSGAYAYVADHAAGLRVISIANPQSPQEVGHCNTPGWAHGVAVSGAYAYVADHAAGLRVISVANPQNPQEVGHYDTPGYAYGVAVSGAYAYVADGGAGLRVISIAIPESPQEVGYYETPDSAYGVAVSGAYAYVADAYAGLQIVEFLGPGVEETPQAGLRTPSRGATIVRGVLVLGAADRRLHPAYTADLCDAAGRKVMDLRPGENDIRRLGPGVYFVCESQAHAPRKVIIAE